MICVLAVAFVTVGCGDAADTAPDQQLIEETDMKAAEGDEKTEEEEAVDVATETVVESVYNPLTNEMVEGRIHRPIAVMLDNSGPARPQSGIGSADIVYEMPVEGGYSRLMALFTNITDSEVGPIRSARPCFLDRAMEIKTIYVHCGGSDRAYEDIRSEDIENIDQASAQASVFWRADHRESPHNVYTTLEKIAAYANVLNYENSDIIPVFNFSDVEKINEDSENSVNDVDMWIFEDYTVQYQYNQETNQYDRYVNNKLYKDEETDQQVSVSNIIFQSCKTKRDDGSYDGNGRTIVYSVGEGEGYLLTGGGVEKITWLKTDRYEVTEYFDEAGNPIQLNAGKTWVHVLEQSDSVRFDGEAVLD
jgi:hypothetical protein